jgi:hypothetical protein
MMLKAEWMVEAPQRPTKTAARPCRDWLHESSINNELTGGRLTWGVLFMTVQGDCQRSSS